MQAPVLNDRGGSSPGNGHCRNQQMSEAGTLRRAATEACCASTARGTTM